MLDIHKVRECAETRRAAGRMGVTGLWKYWHSDWDHNKVATVVYQGALLQNSYWADRVAEADCTDCNRMVELSELAGHDTGGPCLALSRCCGQRGVACRIIVCIGEA